MTSPIYNLTLHRAYYDKGFFNLGVSVDRLIRLDNGAITLFLGEERREISGRVNRKANRNGTPRVYGSELSTWFKENFQLMAVIDVVILSPEQLWLRKPARNDMPLATPKITEPIQPLRKTRGGPNFQRIGAANNAQVGNEFELQAQSYFAQQGINLTRHHSVFLGVSTNKKGHKFDLGQNNPKIIVECKSHTWTTGDNVPSAKMTVWNEVMYYFFLAPREYRKILFVLKNYSAKRRKTLAECYIQTYGHLIPPGVEILEYDPDTQGVTCLRK